MLLNLNKRPYLQNAQFFLCRGGYFLFVVGYVERKCGKGGVDGSDDKRGYCHHSQQRIRDFSRSWGMVHLLTEE